MIKTMLARVRQYKKESILAPAFMAGEVIMEVLVPFFMASLIDLGVSRGDMSYILRMSLFLGVLAGISLVSGALSGTYAARASAGFAANLRGDIYRNIQGFSFANIDRFSPASLITRITTDTHNMMMAYQSIIRMAVRAVMMISFSLLMSFTVNVKISLIFIVVIPVLGAVPMLITLHVHPIFVRAFRQYDRLNNIVGENLRGIRVVKSFVRGETEILKFDEVSGEIYSDFVRAQKRATVSMPFLQLCIYSCTILISWLGARMIVSDVMSTGQLMSVLSYAMQILMNLMNLSQVFVMIIISLASAQRIAEVLGEVPTIQNPENPIKSVPDGSIAMRNVSFSYDGDPDKLSLQGINLDIAAGETIGIVGGTGSAKTSLVQLIPRLYDATEGAVEVGGIDVRAYDIEALRDSVAVVLQKNTLFSGTIKDNLRWGNAHASDEELIHACKLAQAHGFIQGFPKGYDTYIEQDGSNVSGGQRQRLCIARALLKKPKILILDDSTSAVDTKTDALIRRAFREELPGTTKLIIAQRISSVQDADRILVMDDGRLLSIGTHEELLSSSEIYSEVFHSQIGGGDFDAEQ